MSIDKKALDAVCKKYNGNYFCDGIQGIVRIPDILEAYEAAKAEQQPDDWQCGYDAGYLTGMKDCRKPERESRWERIRDFRGEPKSSPLAWWWGATDGVVLDEVLLDENGEVCGKGRCGAQYFSHIMLAADDLPKPPEEQGRRG